LLDEAELRVWDFNFEENKYQTLAALIGARNELASSLLRVPARIEAIKLALAKA
jgi:hypothetical protein